MAEDETYFLEKKDLSANFVEDEYDPPVPVFQENNSSTPTPVELSFSKRSYSRTCKCLFLFCCSVVAVCVIAVAVAALITTLLNGSNQLDGETMQLSSNYDTRLKNLEMQLKETQSTAEQQRLLLIIKLNTTEDTVDLLTSQISFLQTLLNHSNDEINRQRSNVSSLTAEQSSLRRDLTAAQSTLASVGSQLNGVGYNITYLSSVQSSIQQDIDTTQANLNSTVESLTRQIDIIQLMQNALDAKYNMSIINENITHLLSTISADISTVLGNITSLVSRTTALEDSYVTLNTRQGTIRNDLNNTQSVLDGINSQIRSIMANLSSSTSPSAVNLYRNCHKDTSTCTVIRHSATDFWYRCTTPYRAINITGFYTLNMQCERDPDEIYIESAYIEISSGLARCHCDIVGLTESGVHGNIFIPPPTGECYLVITRCPISQNLT